MAKLIMALLAATALVTGCRVEEYRMVPVERTPYDSEWEKVRRSLADMAMFEYNRKHDGLIQWQLPEETERERRGDCTALATLLYQRMLKAGVSGGRIVFGDYRDQWHAWVEWRDYILDPSLSLRPISRQAAGEYRPVWAYDLSGKYRFEAIRAKG